MSLQKLIQYKQGKIPQGLGINLPDADRYLTYKPNRFTCIVGRPNIGKTYWMLWYFTCLAKIHGLRFSVYSIENEIWILQMYIVEFLLGCPIDKAKIEDIKLCNTFINTHFNFVEQQDYTIQDLLKVFSETGYGNYLIDPYNALTKPKGVNQHDYDYECIRAIQAFKMKHGSVYVNHHPFTQAQRRKVSDDNTEFGGYPDFMHYYDIEGGGKWMNGADSFISLHRFTSHPDQFRKTFVNIEKEKVTQTGGGVTPAGSYLQIELENGVFKHKNVDPLLNYRDVKTQYDLQPNENFNNIDDQLPF
jgi:hypothetical protein